jgi:anaerobic magnesium-protoporphyrin IX monomethyl ester cyclase
MQTSNKILLIHPPYGDFTRPYHSLSYVIPSLKAAGYEVTTLDLNILWFNYVFNKDWINKKSAILSDKFSSLNGKSCLTPLEQEDLILTVTGLEICKIVDPEIVQTILKNDRFYVYEDYMFAEFQIRQFEKLLSIVHDTTYFNSSFSIPEHFANAQDLVERSLALNDFQLECASVIDQEVSEQDFLFAGVSIPFTSHLPFGLSILRLLRSKLKCRVIAGGTVINDIVKYATSVDALVPFLKACDDFYYGEAELGVADYAHMVASGLIKNTTNVINLHDPSRILEQGGTNFVSLGGKEAISKYKTFDWLLNPPDYSWISWNDYLSPEPILNYSPSRGCFWNKCTFCDYGLNTNGPTAPSRTMRADVVLDHLIEIQKKFGLKNFYFAVDAISPSFLNDFAELLISSGKKFSWYTELFLTKSFSEELVEKLSKAGMVTASFGLESGSDRILKLMGKGSDRTKTVINPVLEAFRKSIIGLQPKYFVGFPSENDLDRQMTKDVLMENYDVFSIVAKANRFVLTEGSIIAKNADKFGITSIARSATDNIGGNLIYTTQNKEELCESRLQAFNSDINYPGPFERPWVGGIDTFHSFLFLKKFDRMIFHRLSQTASRTSEPISFSIKSRFDLEALFYNVHLRNLLKTKINHELVSQIAGEDFEEVKTSLDMLISAEPTVSTYIIRLRL